MVRLLSLLCIVSLSGSCDSTGTAMTAGEVSVAGAEPRRELSYRPGGGERRVRLSFAHTGMDGESFPGIRIDYTLSWRRPKSLPGKFEYEVVAAEMPVPSAGKEEQETVGKIADQLVGVAGVAEVGSSSSIAIRRTSLKRSVPQIPALLRILSVPLPKGPVGQGSRWTARFRSEQEVESVDFEVTELSERALKLSVRGRGERPDDSKPSSTYRWTGNLKIGLDDCLALEGMATIDFDRAAPVSGAPPARYSLELHSL